MHEKPSKLRSALIGGLVIGAVSGIPGVSLINCCCCAGIWLGGMLTLYLYKNEFTGEMLPLESSDALLVGLMSGVVGAFVAMIISLPFLSIQSEIVRSVMEKILDRMAENGGMPSDMMDQMKEEFERSLRESASVSGILGNLFISLIVYPIFSMLGGLLGYAIFKPKTPPQQAVPTA